MTWFLKVSNVHAAWVSDQPFLLSAMVHNTAEPSPSRAPSSAGRLACISSLSGRGPARRDGGKSKGHWKSLRRTSVQKETQGWSWTKQGTRGEEKAEAVRAISKQDGKTWESVYVAACPKMRCCLIFVWTNPWLSNLSKLASSSIFPASSQHLSYCSLMQCWTWEMWICAVCWKSCCDICLWWAIPSKWEASVRQLLPLSDLQG